MHAKDFWESKKRVESNNASGEPDQMLSKSLMQHVSECTLPSFSYIYFPRECENVNDELEQNYVILWIKIMIMIMNMETGSIKI